jgi:hypothetical protein
MALSPSSSRGVSSDVAPVNDAVMRGAGGGWEAGKVTNAYVDAAAAIAASKLAGYPANAAKVLGGDGTWPDAAVLSGGLVPTPNLGGGGASAAKFLRGDQAWHEPDVATLFDSALGGDAANIDASGLDQGWKHLRVVGLVRTTVAAVLSSVSVTVNGDTGANYHRQTARMANISFSGILSTAQTEWSFSAVGASGTAGWFAQFDLLILDYAIAKVHAGQCYNVCMATTTGADIRWENHNVRHIGTNAITRVTVAAPSLNLLAGSRVTIYGLK